MSKESKKKSGFFNRNKDLGTEKTVSGDTIPEVNEIPTANDTTVTVDENKPVVRKTIPVTNKVKETTEESIVDRVARTKVIRSQDLAKYQEAKGMRVSVEVSKRRMGE